MSNQKEKFNQYKKNKAKIIQEKKKLPNGMIRKTLRPIFRSCLWIQRILNGFSVEVLSDIKVREDRAVFALTHIGKWDFEIVNEHIKAQFFVVAADFIHMWGLYEFEWSHLCG